MLKICVFAKVMFCMNQRSDSVKYRFITLPLQSTITRATLMRFDRQTFSLVVWHRLQCWIPFKEGHSANAFVCDFHSVSSFSGLL
jgi:hypothetical protein